MSEPTAVIVYEAQPGTWLPIVGEADALDLSRPFRVVAEHDYAKLALALTLANQRTEAAEAKAIDYEAAYWEQARDVWSALGINFDEDGEKIGDTDAITRIKELTAERDALRKDAARFVVDDAMVERVARKLAERYSANVTTDEHDAWLLFQTSFMLEARCLIDAALAVQP